MAVVQADHGPRPWRVGIDTGGTFVDLVAQPPDGGPARLAKLPRDTPTDRLTASLVALGVSGPALIVHGTTHVTNAILESRFARTGLVTTRGFRDVLRIGRQSRDGLYDLEGPARAAPIVPAELAYEIDERLAPDGTITRPLADSELHAVASWARDLELEAVAVCLLHAYANPEHERRVGAALNAVPAVSLSHRITAEAREYERAAATVLNASVQGGARAYLRDLSGALAHALPDSAVFVVQSAGGMIPTQTAGDLPLATVMSGPAAGAAASSWLARRGGIQQIVTCDVGGTSTDVSLILGGTPAVARDRTVAGRVVRIPAIAVESIAVGGGSIVAVDDVGALTVGPESAGASPGPACYGRGGREPTITDAALECRLVGAGGTVPGLELRRDLARAALQRVGDRLNLAAGELAWRAVDVAQGMVASVLGTVVSRQGYDIRDCTLVAYGGGGGIHAGPLAARLGIARVLVPAMAPVFSALGCCLAEVGIEAIRTHRRRLEDAGLPELETAAEELVADEMVRLGHPADGAEVSRWLELRYLGQNSELGIPWRPGTDADALRRAFDDAHRREYGFDSTDPIEVVAVRCRLRVAGSQSWPASEPDAAEPESSTTIVLTDGRRAEAPIVGLAAIVRQRLRGPALVATHFGSITVCPDQSAHIDDEGNVVLEAV